MMELRKPKPKKVSPPEGKQRLPVMNEKEIIGIFNGHSVTVPDLDSMIYLYEAGCFGKGSLSKGEPKYHTKKDDIPKILLQQQFENQTKWNASTSYCHPQTHTESMKNDFRLSLESVSNFLQSSFRESEQGSWKSWKEKHQECQNENIKDKTPNANFLLESDEGDYKDEDFISLINNILQSKQIKKPNAFNFETGEIIVLNTSFNPHGSDLSTADINARFESLPFMPVENLSLSLEESFYLKSVCGCLRIVDLNLSEMDIPDLWKIFNLTNKNFLERYITYHYYRSKGWVVRSGLKFGGDYLLYKDGPAYYHASYLVKVLDKTKKLTWREFLSMNRLVETYNKDLILSDVSPTGTSEEKSFPEALKNYSVQEILVKRWFPSKERFSKADDET